MNIKFANKPISSDVEPKPCVIRDAHHRPLSDLRISVIDRCNLRCAYCMPKENLITDHTFLKKSDWLTFAEIERLARLFVHLGVSKIRLTGGEPLLRPELSKLIERLNNIQELKDLALTTNGILLSQHAQALKDAGLERITVSLDTLDPYLFRQINGQRGELTDVLNGIQKCEEAGFKCIKVNVVVKRNINHHTILDLVRHFKGTGHILRFIEYMDAGNCNRWEEGDVVPNKEIFRTVNGHYPLRPLEPSHYGEVANRYAFEDGEGEIGFISSVSQPFCKSCTRLRLSADGKLYTCLFAEDSTDLKTPLRQGASDAQLITMIRNVWQNRIDRYSENRSLFRAFDRNSKRAEMFQVGG